MNDATRNGKVENDYTVQSLRIEVITTLNVDMERRFTAATQDRHNNWHASNISMRIPGKRLNYRTQLSQVTE